MAQFDGADPNASTPQRESTTVPTQALYFMNGRFVHEQAGKIALRILGAADVEARAVEVYVRVLQRAPADEERRRAAAFVEAYPGTPKESWAAWAKVLCASNEFLYVD